MTPGAIIFRIITGRVFNLKAAPLECYFLTASSESILDGEASTIEKLRKKALGAEIVKRRSGRKAHLERRNTTRFREWLPGVRSMLVSMQQWLALRSNHDAFLFFCIFNMSQQAAQSVQSSGLTVWTVKLLDCL